MKACIKETLTERNETFSTSTIKSYYSKLALMVRKLCDQPCKPKL